MLAPLALLALSLAPFDLSHLAQLGIITNTLRTLIEQFGVLFEISLRLLPDAPDWDILHPYALAAEFVLNCFSCAISRQRIGNVGITRRREWHSACASTRASTLTAAVPICWNGSAITIILQLSLWLGPAIAVRALAGPLC